MCIRDSSWVKDTDYTLSLRVTDASGAERKAEFGTAVNWGKTYTSCLFVVGDTVSVTATPNAETHPNYNPATASKTPTMNDSLSPVSYTHLSAGWEAANSPEIS